MVKQNDIAGGIAAGSQGGEPTFVTVLLAEVSSPLFFMTAVAATGIVFLVAMYFFFIHKSSKGAMT
jgi:hypothetical protein